MDKNGRDKGPLKFSKIHKEKNSTISIKFYFLEQRDLKQRGADYLPQLGQKWVCVAAHHLFGCLEYLSVVIKNKVMFNRVVGIAKDSECPK